MRLFRVCWQDKDHGNMQRWSASERDARKSVTEIKAEYDADKDWTHQLAVEAVEVPVASKADFVDWLNRHFDTDNG